MDSCWWTYSACSNNSFGRQLECISSFEKYWQRFLKYHVKCLHFLSFFQKCFWEMVDKNVKVKWLNSEEKVSQLLVRKCIREICVNFVFLLSKVKHLLCKLICICKKLKKTVLKLQHLSSRFSVSTHLDTICFRLLNTSDFAVMVQIISNVVWRYFGRISKAQKCIMKLKSAWIF